VAALIVAIIIYARMVGRADFGAVTFITNFWHEGDAHDQHGPHD
jgi:hypothetical protein